jgi:hypothetical protein
LEEKRVLLLGKILWFTQKIIKTEVAKSVVNRFTRSISPRYGTPIPHPNKSKITYKSREILIA